MSLLSEIRGPDDLKTLHPDTLPSLAEEIRAKVIQVTADNGGHLGPNLGVVELTIALHRVFDSPSDHFVFDVSHQGYVHKLLTGRNDARFDQIRRTGGLNGFLSREESPYDCYGAGHAGTALSAALGIACARDHLQGKEHVIAVCGDAAFTCGITYEALNNISQTTKRLIIILNDNEWSIDKNVGAIARHLNRLLTNPVYNRINEDMNTLLNHIPGGDFIRRIGSRAKKETKDMFLESSVFETFGLRYLGPVDGHNINTLVQFLEFAKNEEGPVLLHVITQKGKGCDIALDEPEKFHGTSPFNPDTGISIQGDRPLPPTLQDVFGHALVRHARKDSRILGITGAMPSGTGLCHLRDAIREQYVDVGIAEEHAVIFAAGAATRGLKPVVAIYSTFIQRSYDPIIHDVCLQNLDVLFCMDRSGLSPNDGPTHHGLFDIAFLRCIPNTVIMQPRNEDLLCDMIATGLESGGPVFIRYPRGHGDGAPIKDEPAILPMGKAETLREGKDCVLWAIGPMVGEALAIADCLGDLCDLSIGVVDARFIKPLDTALLLDQCAHAHLIITLEDHSRTGGFGSAVAEEIADAGFQTPVCRIGWPDRFIGHATGVHELRSANGLSREAMLDTILRHPAIREHRLLAPSSTD